AGIQVPRQGAGGVERLEAVDEGFRAHLADRQHLRPRLEGQRLPGHRSVGQIAKLKADEKLGKLEVVWFSHAHYDHYDGIYDLPDRDSFEVWTLDSVAEPIANPMRLRAPFLDARPVKIDRVFKEGESATWR